MWKKANVVPVHKKDNKQNVKNYRPISLLPIFGKMFERLIFCPLYTHLINNNLISSKQSGFIKGDSTINQLLSITHMIHSAFDCDPPKEVRSIYLDISKAFDKVWHEGLIFKLKQNGVNGVALSILTAFLSNRSQRTVINGKSSDWHIIEAGVPQGSVLGPLLFLIYINDLINGMKSDARIFADDTSLFIVVDDPQAAHELLSHDLRLVESWATQWRMSFNPDVTKPPVEVIFSTKQLKPNHPLLIFNGTPLHRADEHKHLGLILDSKLSFVSHTNELIKKGNKAVSVLKCISRYVPRRSLDQIYKSFVRSKVEYGDVIFHQPPTIFQSYENQSDQMKKIESVQYNAALAVSGAWNKTSRNKVYQELGWESLCHRRWYKRMCLFHKIVNKISPKYLSNLIRFSNPPLTTARGRLVNREETNKLLLRNFKARTNKFNSAFFPSCTVTWNTMLEDANRRIIKHKSFKQSLLGFFKPKKSDMYGVLNKIGMRCLTLLRLDLNPLKLYKFNHNFHDTNDPMCPINDGIEDKEHFLLDCHAFVRLRNTLMNNVSVVIGSNILTFQNNEIIKILLYGDKKFSRAQNTKILNFTIDYIIKSERFKKVD